MGDSEDILGGVGSGGGETQTGSGSSRGITASYIGSSLSVLTSFFSTGIGGASFPFWNAEGGGGGGP